MSEPEPEVPDQSPDVFISYARKDEERMKRLEGMLQDRRVSIWRDSRSSGAGRDYRIQIMEAIEGCDVCLYLVSGNSVASQSVTKEITQALEENKRIIPVFLSRDVELPKSLKYEGVGQIERVDWWEGLDEQEADAFEKLIEALKKAGVSVGEREAASDAPSAGRAEARTPSLDPTVRASPARSGDDSAEVAFDEVFISYSRTNSKWVEAFQDKLHERAVTVFRDTEDLRAGKSWREQLVSAIRQCRVFVLVASERSFDSKNVGTELSIAEAEGKPILPIYLEPLTLPDTIAYQLGGGDIQHVKAFGGNEWFDEILRALVAEGVSVDGRRDRTVTTQLPPKRRETRRHALFIGAGAVVALAGVIYQFTRPDPRASSQLFIHVRLPNDSMGLKGLRVYLEPTLESEDSQPLGPYELNGRSSVVFGSVESFHSMLSAKKEEESELFDWSGSGKSEWNQRGGWSTPREISFDDLEGEPLRGKYFVVVRDAYKLKVASTQADAPLAASRQQSVQLSNDLLFITVMVEGLIPMIKNADLVLETEEGDKVHEIPCDITSGEVSKKFGPIDLCTIRDECPGDGEGSTVRLGGITSRLEFVLYKGKGVQKNVIARSNSSWNLRELGKKLRADSPFKPDMTLE